MEISGKIYQSSQKMKIETPKKSHWNSRDRKSSLAYWIYGRYWIWHFWLHYMSWINLIKNYINQKKKNIILYLDEID
jgi:hypothetical protein